MNGIVVGLIHILYLVMLENGELKRSMTIYKVNTLSR